jgi:serine/threonine protein phosphatase PrpC
MRLYLAEEEFDDDEGYDDEDDDGLTPDEKKFAMSLVGTSDRVVDSGGVLKWNCTCAADPDLSYKMVYGHVSQTGFYPDTLEKANQDTVLVVENFGSMEDSALFVVLDGHGQTGTECSQFGKSRLPNNIIKSNQYVHGGLGESFREGVLATNRQMHRQKRRQGSKAFDDSLSGTTCIGVLVKGREIIVANVGDSRAVVAQQKGDRLLAYALSVDQTPFRKDERDRCKIAGAAVLTMDQMEGIRDADDDDFGNEEEDDGDPPRLWCPGEGYPGCAFTRSLGDEIAESIGVTGEPEMLKKDLGPNDKFIVVASDGVFEFLSNQQVVDIVAKFDDPFEAARTIVAESYKLWLQYEVRTDDISAIVIFLEELVRPGMMNAPKTIRGGSVAQKARRGTADGITTGFSTVLACENRPVRRMISREKRALISGAMSVEDDDDDGDAAAAPKLVPKSPEEVAMIQKSTHTNFLFSHLNKGQREQVYASMYDPPPPSSFFFSPPFPTITIVVILLLPTFSCL